MSKLDYCLASRVWRQGVCAPITFWVQFRPGDEGKDWGYTENPSAALPLSPYWCRRFASYCRHVNARAKFVTVSPDHPVAPPEKRKRSR